MEERIEERIYDLIFIARPDTPEEEIDKIVSSLEQTVTERHGTVEKTEKWGTRKLAYQVRRHREGYYVLMVIHSTQGDLIPELERRLRVFDSVIKYQTVRLDEEMRWAAKQKLRKERRAARRPRKAPAAAPAPEAAAAPESAPAAS